MATDERWRLEPLLVGDDRALRHTSSSVALCFGLGPATGHGVDEERLHRVTDALGLDGAAWLRQEHGTRLVRVSSRSSVPVSCAGNGDGLITSERGLALAVWTADCVPVLLAASAVVAAVHAGWRGTAAGIVPLAVQHLLQLTHGRPETITASLGPAICGRHYQVGLEVIDALAAADVDEQCWRNGDHVDLRTFITAQLLKLGVTDIRTVDRCTYSDPELASYRRDGAAAGRQWSLVALTPTRPS